MGFSWWLLVDVMVGLLGGGWVFFLVGCSWLADGCSWVCLFPGGLLGCSWVCLFVGSWVCLWLIIILGVVVGLLG